MQLKDEHAAELDAQLKNAEQKFKREYQVTLGEWTNHMASQLADWEK